MDRVRSMTAREFLIAFGPRLKELARDAETMSAAAFKRKHGLDVRECRANIKRLKELSARKEGNDAEVRELVGVFATISYRKAG